MEFFRALLNEPSRPKPYDHPLVLLDLKGFSIPMDRTGVIFAGLHWPNPVLVPLTFIGGTAMSWLFSRERNIIPLTVGQALLGTLVWWVFPVAWHHGMRVGPGYYSFHP